MLVGPGISVFDLSFGFESRVRFRLSLNESAVCRGWILNAFRHFLGFTQIAVEVFQKEGIRKNMCTVPLVNAFLSYRGAKE